MACLQLNLFSNFPFSCSTSTGCFVFLGRQHVTTIIMEVKPWSQDWLIAAGAYPGFCSMERLEIFLLPLDGMLVHRRSLPRNLIGFPNNLQVLILERGTVRVKCLAQRHNTMSQARAQNPDRSLWSRTHQP